jgi:hypothetical protein
MYLLSESCAYQKKNLMLKMSNTFMCKHFDVNHQLSLYAMLARINAYGC